MRILGIDASSKSVGYAIIDDGVLVKYGQYFLDGANPYRRMTDAMLKTQALIGEFDDVDYIVFEQAVRVVSVSTALTMAKVFGAVMAVLGQTKAVVMEVPPLTWQSYIGNKNISGGAKTEYMIAHPELKTKSQVSKSIREFRKQYTMNWVKKNFDVQVKTDDISDSIAVAWYAYNKVKEIHEA